MFEFCYWCTHNCFNPTTVANKCQNYFSVSEILWFLYMAFVEYNCVSVFNWDEIKPRHWSLSGNLNSVCDEDLFLAFLSNQPSASSPILLRPRDKHHVISSFCKDLSIACNCWYLRPTLVLSFSHKNSWRILSEMDSIVSQKRGSPKQCYQYLTLRKFRVLISFQKCYSANQFKLEMNLLLTSDQLLTHTIEA